MQRGVWLLTRTGGCCVRRTGAFGRPQREGVGWNAWPGGAGRSLCQRVSGGVTGWRVSVEVPGWGVSAGVTGRRVSIGILATVPGVVRSGVREGSARRTADLGLIPAGDAHRALRSRLPVAYGPGCVAAAVVVDSETRGFDRPRPRGRSMPRVRRRRSLAPACGQVLRRNGRCVRRTGARGLQPEVFDRNPCNRSGCRAVGGA